MKLSLLFSLGLICAVALSTVGCATVSAGGSSVPELGPTYPGVASYVVVDTHDQKVVLAHAADQKRSVASLTKVATAVVVLDSVAAMHGNLDEALVIPPSAAMLGQSALSLQPGDQMSVRDALYCALMGSDNAAAEALAVHVGAKIGQFQNQGQNPMSAFLTQMNALASKLGMTNTKFVNAHGLDMARPLGYSSAADIARLTMHAINKGDFNFFVSQQTRNISFRRGGRPMAFKIKNTNELLGKDRIDGVKTGTTQLAGPCLVISASRPATVVKQADGSTLVVPHRLIVVVLGAQDRFNQAQQLLRQGWASYDAWHAAGRQVVTAGELLRAPTPNQ